MKLEINYKRLLIITLITFSLAANVFFAVQYTISQLELRDALRQIVAQDMNNKSLSFAKMFVDKFLLSSGTVNFEDRLALENAVREIKDPEIFKQWQIFTNSPDDHEAQLAAGKLFNLLFDRIKK